MMNHTQKSTWKRTLGSWISQHVVNPVRQLINWYRKHKKRPMILAAVWAATSLFTFGMGAFVKPSLVPWYAKHFTHQHQLHILYVPWRTDQAKCTLLTFALGTVDSIDSLHISMRFNQPIHGVSLQRGYTRSGDNVNVKLGSSTPRFTSPPCEIAGPSTDKDESLTFATSSDHHQIIVSGHDVTLYDTQNLLVAIYPDETRGATPVNIFWDADATYQAFGYPVPVKFSFYKLDPSGHSVHLFDTTERLVKLQ